MPWTSKKIGAFFLGNSKEKETKNLNSKLVEIAQKSVKPKESRRPNKFNSCVVSVDDYELVSTDVITRDECWLNEHLIISCV